MPLSGGFLEPQPRKPDSSVGLFTKAQITTDHTGAANQCEQ